MIILFEVGNNKNLFKKTVFADRVGGQLRRIGADQCFGSGAQWTYGQMAAQTAGLELSSSDVF